MPRGRIEHNTIKNNYCEGEYALGGGIHGASDQAVERYLYILDNTIENNECHNTKSSGRSGGGGVDTWGGVVLYLFDNIIMYNRVHPTHQADGGGVDLVYAVAPSIIQGNTISFNSYSGTDCAGGGLMLNRCEGVRVKNNRIEGNRAVWGGGIYLNRSHDIVIDNNHFERNIARNNGGGLNKYMDQDNNVAHINLLLEGEISGSVISRQEFTFSDSIRNNKFINNQATQYNGGGIYISTSEKSTISGNMFQGNQAAQGWGGGLLVRNAKATITNNVFTENLSNGGGGIGLAISGDDTVGIFDVINNTVVENRGNEGAGIANMRGTSTLINNIVWGNIGPKQIANQAEGTIYVSFSDIQGGEASVENTENSITEWLDGNIDADPLFADSVNFYLSENSPCIDAGHIHFLDPEDPDHPNFALWPAMRTRRSDMGAYGGADSLATRLSDKGVVSRRPAQFILYPNYPNPFNPSTTIIYDLPHTALVQLAVYDVLGREVKRLVDEQKSPGLHKITWDATNESGQRVAAGLYFCRMRSGDFATVIKLLFVR